MGSKKEPMGKKQSPTGTGQKSGAKKGSKY